MLYTEEFVKSNIRNRDGARVFFLGDKDTLTPSARDWLRRERIEIRPAKDAKIRYYQLPGGEMIEEKSEDQTHLRGNILTEKTDPIISFRGKIDTLQAEILLAQLSVDTETRAQLEELLSLVRQILRWEVMEEPVEYHTICGMTAEQLRERSHFPQKYYHQPHFMPGYSDGVAILQLNRVRCAIREAELSAAHAFCSATAGCHRPDILQLLNRLSSLVYIIMIRLKAKG